eukprot:TRINITY_DN7303_c0_g1_i1.p1 TRINITY_DN7303_c0_g1~~TRINITY_DN7303_c0_g1_i1.p1  ORF type:complete len:310 (-),score=34.28 TRINITY_DN7303_c0_g1_i1:169-984(-)
MGGVCGRQRPPPAEAMTDRKESTPRRRSGRHMNTVHALVLGVVECMEDDDSPDPNDGAGHGDRARGADAFLPVPEEREPRPDPCEKIIGSDGRDGASTSSGSDGTLSETSESGEVLDTREFSRETDFSGSWVCSRVEGDWDAFLKESGTSWAIRKAIAALGFGVGSQMQRISQSAERLEVSNIVRCHPPREVHCRYRTDGIEEQIVDLEGRSTLSTTRWEGQALVTEQRLLDSEVPLPTARRFLQGSEMCTERVSTSGLIVKRFYTRASND